MKTAAVKNRVFEISKELNDRVERLAGVSRYTSDDVLWRALELGIERLEETYELPARQAEPEKRAA